MADRQLSLNEQKLLEIIYELVGRAGKWPTFMAVDLRADRELGIEDVQTVLVAIPAQYLARPGHPTGYYDTDELRLTLSGVAQCEGGTEDIELLARFMAWLVGVEGAETSETESLTVMSADFAAYAGMPLEPVPVDAAPEEPTPEREQVDAVATPGTMGAVPTAESIDEVPAEVASARGKVIRVRVLADLLPRFWGGAGWQTDTPWYWQLTVDRRRLRPYRHVSGVAALLEYADSHDGRHLAPSPVAISAVVTAADLKVMEEPSVPGAGVSADTDVLLTLLRDEIADSAAELLRADRYDEAIFAAFRRLEHEVQQRANSPAIGDTLVKAAFREMSMPIRVSDREQDQERLVELFGGAIGLFKGDRSHKDKPLLPCRSRRECMRVLAHASSLLDLLDRDVDRAPVVRGYEHHQGDTLTLWVERAGPQVVAWLDDDTSLDIVSWRPGTLVLNVAGVSAGPHTVHLAEGSRQGPGHEVWLTRDPGQSSWYRVIEIDIPVYADAAGTQPVDASAVRLAVREAGVATERVVVTNETYRVGHYVTWGWSAMAHVGPIWMKDEVTGQMVQIYSSTALFAGDPVAPSHEPQLMNISIEPAYLRPRPGERLPVRVLGSYTDGTATWSEELGGLSLSSLDSKVAHCNGGTVYAKVAGRTSLKCLYERCYAETAVEVASHPRGTVTEYVGGLPPVAGIAWTPKGLVVSTRGTALWLAHVDGHYRIAAETPMYFGHQGTDTLSANDMGDLAVRIIGDSRFLVLHADHDYRTSRWVEPPAPGTTMACAFDGDDLIVAMSSCDLYRVRPDGTSSFLTALKARAPVAMASGGDTMLVVCRGHGAADHLWRVTLADPANASDLLAGLRVTDIGGVTTDGNAIYLTEFHKGMVIRLENGSTSVVVTGLTAPVQLAATASGDLFVGEFGAGKVRRVLP